MAFRIAVVQTVDRQINQLQNNIKQAIEPLFADQAGSWIASLTGCTTVPQAKLYWEQAAQGGPVTISVTTPLFGTSNTSAATITGLPKAFWPAQTQFVQIPITDNGTTVMSTATIDSNGVFALYKSLIGASFTTSGFKGLYPCNFTYVLGI